MSHTPGLFPKCGCKIVGASYPFQIVYCPLHAAAPALLEACHKALPLLKLNGYLDTEQAVKQAIAHAEGRG